MALENIFQVVFFFFWIVGLFFWDAKLLRKSAKIQARHAKKCSIIVFVALTIIVVGFANLYNKCYPDKLTTWFAFGATIILSIPFVYLLIRINKWIRNKKETGLEF